MEGKESLIPVEGAGAVEGRGHKERVAEGRHKLGGLQGGPGLWLGRAEMESSRPIDRVI